MSLNLWRLFRGLLSAVWWSSVKLQDKMMGEIHANGKTIEDIEEVLRRVPIHPRIVPAIKSAHALGYHSLRTLSNTEVYQIFLLFPFFL